MAPLCLAAVCGAIEAARAADGRPVVASLTVTPSSIVLSGPRAQARALVSAALSDGSVVDVTDQATFTPSTSGTMRIDADGTLHPVKDGSAVLKVGYGGRSARAVVTVKEAQAHVPVSFDNEIEPALTRLGCNQGSCHGSQYGKGGFKLSLAAFDPDLDYINIVKQGRGRRISMVDPGHSLLLLKPALRVPHGGGRRLEIGSPSYCTLMAWLQDGAPGPKSTDPAVTKLEALPAERILRKGGPTQRLVVRATYSDGTVRDVTSDTRLNTLNDAVAACTPDGKVSPVGKGQTAIMVRYGGLATVATVIVPFGNPKAKSPNLQITGQREEGKGKREKGTAVLMPNALNGLHGDASARIDALVAHKQQQLGLQPSPLCDDRTFARRVYLDLIGTPPTTAELKAFLSDPTSDRRIKLVDRLLERPEYADYWTLKWGDLLRSNRTSLGDKGMWSFTNWIRTQLAQNRPVDQFVRDLIVAQGSTFTNGPANFYRVANNPQDLAETASQVFLGVRMQCARCHHHPFEKWSQTDYYQFAAFFARVGQKGSNEFGIFGNETIVRINDGGEVTHPKTGAVMHPTPLGAQLAVLPGGKQPDPDADGDRRQALAQWITGPQNRLFSRNIANRYWGYLLGKGIVNPIDDQRVTNPPTNPALLDFLADELVSSKFDLKHLLRIICNSNTYQRSSEATRDNRSDELFFTHFLPRRLPAETLLDAIDFACGTQEKFNNLPAGTRAIQLPDPNVGSDFLDVFGRPQRLIACECERVAEPNLSQTLSLMNGGKVNGKVTQGDGRIARQINAKMPDDLILNDLYLAALGRPPQARERNVVLGALIFAPDRKAVFEDVLLTLLNSKEFLFNH
jgi:hypothetical protein